MEELLEKSEKLIEDKIAASKAPIKHIFVTGGVTSSLGKGLTAASLGRLLTQRGLKVNMQKLDPYLNVDPVQMDPLEHGEVFITDDGGTIDLDVGHYERFLDRALTCYANVTTGKIYSKVIEKERSGFYNGKTVQVIPHITDEIKENIYKMREPDSRGETPDVVITEIGGTVGDIESLPFIEAIRQVKHDLGGENVFFLHISLIPYLRPSKELKTKPTQHSVKELRNIGIQPDALVCRSDRPIPKELKDKISLMCDVDREAVISCPDSESIYEIPKVLYQEKLDSYVVRKLGLEFQDIDWKEWDSLLEKVHNPSGRVRIAIIGSNVDSPDTHLSVTEALNSAGFDNSVSIEVVWLAASKLENEIDTIINLDEIDGIIIPELSSSKDLRGFINAVGFSITNRIPILGIGSGSHCLVLETFFPSFIQERVLTEPLKESPSLEAITAKYSHSDYSEVSNEKSTKLLGSHIINLSENSLVESFYKDLTIEERFNSDSFLDSKWEESLEESGWIITGRTTNGLISCFEYDRESHPFAVGVQFHPEFKSRPTKAHPIFFNFVKESINNQIFSS